MQLNKQEYFCPAPWTAVFLSPYGDTGICCVGKHNLGSLGEQPIEQILAGDEATDIKQKMLDNRPAQGCDSCWRQNKQDRLQNFFVQRYTETPRMPELTETFYQDTKEFKPKYLDLRWNNTCNFACIYCSAEYSSLWADTVASSPVWSERIEPKPTRAIKQELLTWILDNLEGVDYIYLAGGEPLMIKENAVILERLKEVNPNCHLLINTNLSQLHNNKIFDLLKTMPNVQWLISGETVGQQWEYIRWPGKWDVFLSNLHEIKKLEAINHRMSFNLVGMNINCLSIWDYIDLLREQKFAREDKDITINLYNLRDPTCQWAIQRLPPESTQHIIDRINRGGYQVSGLNNYIEALSDPRPDDSTYGMELTLNYLSRFDQSRNLDSRSVFPEIYEYADKLPKI